LAYATILVADDGPVRTITLNRPERRNALTPEMQRELIAAMEAAAAGDCRVLVLRGAGKGFCSGLDLTMLQGLADKGATGHTAEAERIARMFRTLYELPKPTIAVVYGAAIGGGAGLATICDFTLAAPTAKFGYPEARIGFVPAVVSAFLTVQLGDKRTRDLLLTGRLLDAAEAYRLGLVNEIVDTEKMPARVAALAEMLMENSPKSLAATKRLMAAQNRKWLDAAIAEAMSAIADARKTDDLQEGVAAFLEKRKPVWTK
jgi:methylglutaconyl-CoA hydratase